MEMLHSIIFLLYTLILLLGFFPKEGTNTIYILYLYFMNYQIQELFLIIKNELTYILFKSKQMINKEICFFLPHMINTTRSYAVKICKLIL
ncbi:hypothetical protein PFUGPA_00887 [Plasmodium falciparum Palo Alto/Uganda]|uniref:Uncharacterized protein n=2 Tax=Plasmodium falciparum TaxID=5833 RepID=W4J500_PLAFP|nr:hypothetical protein PFUGPA_00887 [Plasmodium falciparum Palo Alto/Uganda]